MAEDWMDLEMLQMEGEMSRIQMERELIRMRQELLDRRRGVDAATATRAKQDMELIRATLKEVTKMLDRPRRLVVTEVDGTRLEAPND